MKTLSVAAGLCLIAFSLPHGAAPASDEGDRFDHEALCVTIWPEKTRVKVGERFPVKLRIVNSSEGMQSFEVMSCSWYACWKCDSPRIAYDGWGCEANSLRTVRLKPGEAYEQTLPLYVPDRGNSHRVPFRMKFTPIGSMKTYWSDEVVVAVE